MEEDNRKNELVKAMANVTFYPTILNKEKFQIERYTKLPLANLSALGVAFEPLTAAFQHVFAGGNATSGLYRVTVPAGGHLATFRNEAANLGAVLSNESNQVMGQARLNPLVLDPTMLFMAAALMSINKKLDDIQESQKEIIEFLQQKEKSKLRGNLNFLTDVLNNYKFNWTNEKYKNSHHIKVLDIKQDADQSILFYREQIIKLVEKSSFLHSRKDVKDKLSKLQSNFKEYQLALYLYSFSSFLDIMLLENFNAEYLDGIAGKIEDYAFQYRELYSECYDHIEGDAKSSIQSHLFGSLAGLNKAVGNAVSKIPVVSNSQIDEALIASGKQLDEYRSKQTEQTVRQLVNYQNSAVYSFVENINTINRLYNQPMELILDNESVYLGILES